MLLQCYYHEGNQPKIEVTHTEGGAKKVTELIVWIDPNKQRWILPCLCLFRRTLQCILYAFKPVDSRFLFLDIQPILTYWKGKLIGSSQVYFFPFKHQNKRIWMDFPFLRSPFHQVSAGNARESDMHPRRALQILQGSPPLSARPPPQQRDRDITFCSLKGVQKEGFALGKIVRSGHCFSLLP